MNRALGVVLMALGAAVVVRTIVAGVGGGLGLLLGALIFGAGAARLYLTRNA